MQLSKRLQAVADFIGSCETLADVGTDHGYIPIYAIQRHIAKRAIAMDINRGPIERAASHIAEHGLEAYIETRCCDGVSGLQAREADAVVIAGMGGGLMQKILNEGRDILADVGQLVLQPQSEIGGLRAYLAGHGYAILQENMVLEDGKFYTMMQVAHGAMEIPDEVCREYGRSLLEMRHPILRLYLERAKENCGQIRKRLYENGRDAKDTRVMEIKKEMQNIDSALAYYEM